ncbi:hypothetical protein MUO79_12235, partial [Candidatus Bathyarchaeota archaeon]|nr:hypothetical protein [Candidatus Bathyarchaeota archaeon]
AYGLFLAPVAVYIAGRLLEKFLGASYRRWKGELVFSEEVTGDSGILTIQTNSLVFLDELTIHLEDRPLDILDNIKGKFDLKGHERVQFSPMDKIRFESVIQSGGDKQLFVYAFVGTKTTDFSESLETDYENPRDFMANTEISIETSRKKYNRKLLKKDC